MRYLFILGNTPALSKAEIESVLRQNQVEIKSSDLILNHFFVELAGPINDSVFDLLGGTIKVVQEYSGDTVDELCAHQTEGANITFGLSGDGSIHLAKEIKRQLQAKGFKARFVVPPRGSTELSSVVVRKQMVAEIYIVPGPGEKPFQGKTIWVQDFEEWGKRDFGRPAVSAHIGMLPPKVARMMVNIAGGSTILDPFCGVGTVLSEAAIIGKTVIGSDIDASQVEKTKKNLAWLGKSGQILVSDSRTVGQRLPEASVDSIVTETFLGPQNNQVLEDLYLASLNSWKRILKPGGKVVIATPFVIDKAKLMGYSFVAGPIIYSRPQAKVRRHIMVFEKN